MAAASAPTTERALLANEAMRPRPSRAVTYARALWYNKPALGAMIAIVVILLCAVFAPWIAPYDPTHQDLLLRLSPLPWQEGGTWSHPLGTDPLGRDILSRVIYGARISLIVGFAAVVVQGALGITLGLIAGYYGGHVDSVIMRVTDVQYALPFLVLAIAVMAVLGPSLRNVILVLGITGWVYYARIVRAEVLSLREREYIEAAKAIGASAPRLVIRHLLPNLTASIIVIASLQVARMIISEASLSFLGLGVPPSIPSWGSMVAEGRTYVATAWWAAAVPGAAIFVTVMSVNLVGDLLSDVLDPTRKGE